MRSPPYPGLAASLLVVAGCMPFEPPLRQAQGSDARMASADDASMDASIDSGPADAGFDAGHDAGTDASVPIPHRPTLAACAFGAPTTMGTITNAALDEISGLAVSRKNASVVWLIEDSGSAAVVHAVSTTGQLLATYAVGGTALDYEDLAIGPGPTPGVDYLYVADIGSNDGSRTSITVYRAPEPSVTSNQAFVTGTLTGTEPLPMTYPPGMNDNAEALFVDPTSEDVYLVTKNGYARPNRLFRLSAPQTPAVSRTLELLGSVYAGDGIDVAVTGADIAADGSWIAIRSLHAANVWPRSSGVSIADTILTTTPCAGPISAEELKGESIGFASDGYFTTSEGASQGLHFVSFTP